MMRRLIPGCCDPERFRIAAHMVNAPGDRELERWFCPGPEIPDMEHVRALGDQLAPIGREFRVVNRPAVLQRAGDGFARLRVPDSGAKIRGRGDKLTVQTEFG